LGTRYCSATRTPTTATAIQKMGLRRKRFTSMFYGAGAPTSSHGDGTGHNRPIVFRRYTVRLNAAPAD
jgi:hypothetical protein